MSRTKNKGARPGRPAGWRARCVSLPGNIFDQVEKCGKDMGISPPRMIAAMLHVWREQTDAVKRDAVIDSGLAYSYRDQANLDKAEPVAA